MNYQEARDEEQLRVLLDEKSINKFIKAATENRQTIIFFPGGMASKLCEQNILNANSSKPLDFKDQEVWLSLWTFGHPELNALKLQLHKEADGFYHDVDDRIIIADGCIGRRGLHRTMTFPLGVKPTISTFLFLAGIGDSLLATPSRFS